MDLHSLMTLFSNLDLTTVTTVWSVIGPFLTAYLARKDTIDIEFEKAKVDTFKDVALQLLDAKELTYVDFYKANNFLTIAEKADAYYAKMEHRTGQHTYDLDWFVRFYEESGTVNNEMLQDIWAKLLAGEINCPATYSLLTISVLKNLNQRDAELFEKVMAYSISFDEPFIPNYESYLKQYKITFDELMYLDEIGLLHSKPLIENDIFANNDRKYFIYNENYCIKIEQTIKDAQPFGIDGYPCTRVGKELASLNKRTLSDEALQRLAKEVKAKIPAGCVASLHKVNGIAGNSIDFNDEDLLS